MVKPLPVVRRTRLRLFADPPPVRLHRFMAGKTLAVAGGLVAAFFLGVPPPSAFFERINFRIGLPCRLEHDRNPDRS